MKINERNNLILCILFIKVAIEIKCTAYAVRKGGTVAS